MAEYNSACIKTIKKLVGVPDIVRKEIAAVIQTKPEVEQKLRQGVLDATSSDVNYSTFSSLVLYSCLELRVPLTHVHFNTSLGDTAIKFLSENCQDSIQVIDLINCDQI